MTAISAVIITYNEAENIEACINALRPVVEEVLIVDSGSTDQTIAIAHDLGARVIKTQWQGYAATKNYGNSLAASDWILSIDADEVVSEELRKSLHALTLSEDKVYALDRLTNFCGQWIKHSGWYPEWKPRLFNRKISQWKGDYVHEKLVHQVAITEERIQGKLYHYSYKSLDDHWARTERYAKLSAQEMYTNGKRASFIKLWVSPIARFFRTFFLKAGFLDGKNGWIISIRNAKLVHLKYKILRSLGPQS
jgi:(heptosyl)LPS beta-1,4-glucosyltransferase